MQADSPHHQGPQLVEALQMSEAVKLPRVDVVNDELLQVWEYHGYELGYGRKTIRIFSDTKFEGAESVTTPGVPGLQSLWNINS